MEISQMHGEAFYDTVDVNFLCRVCCKTSIIPLIPIYSDGSNSLASKIISYLPIKVSQDDILPKKVCIQCANSVIVWHDFFQNCIKADSKLREIFAKRGIQIDNQVNDSAPIAERRFPSVDQSVTSSDVGNVKLGGSENEEEIQVKEETRETNPTLQKMESFPTEPVLDQISQDIEDLDTDIIKIEQDDSQEAITSQDPQQSRQFGETSNMHKECEIKANEDLQFAFVNLLETNMVLLNKSQTPTVKLEKAKTLNNFRREYGKLTGKDMTESQIMKKINNMKTEVRKKADAIWTGNKKINLKKWEQMFLNLRGEINPTINHIPGCCIVGISNSIGKDNPKSSVANLPPFSNSPPQPPSKKRNLLPKTEETKDLTNEELQRIVLLEQLRLIRMQKDEILKRSRNNVTDNSD